MNYTKIIQGIFGTCAALLTLFGVSNLSERTLGAVSSNSGLPGIYNATTTDLSIVDGYGSALAVDQSGRLILSPSSTVPGAGSSATLQEVTTNGASTDVATYLNGGASIASLTASSVAMTLDGTFASPSLSWSSDSDTGFYRGASGQFFATNNGAASFAFTETELTPYVNIVPAYNEVLNLGSSSFAWANGYFGTSTARTAMLGGNTAVGNLSPVYINYTPTQAMADNDSASIFVLNSSSTLYSSIQFKNSANTGDVSTITSYNESAPQEFGIDFANKLEMSSTSGTLMLVDGGSSIAYLDTAGAFRPVTGLGFGGGFAGLNSNASTTITDGNYASASLDYANSAAAGGQDLTITVSGAADGDECQLGVPNALASSSADQNFTCFVSATDTITVRRMCMNAVGCGDPAAATIGAGYFHRQ